VATSAEQLQQAKDAKHKLVTGQLARVFMDQNGERVEYTSTNIDMLNRYIAELEALVTPNLCVRRPIGFIF
jgi:hypothetical protein